MFPLASNYIELKPGSQLLIARNIQANKPQKP
jgi:hypothetical protein